MGKEIKDFVWTPSPAELLSENEWVVSEVNKVGQHTLELLAKLAAGARGNAYQIYSGYSVGAALLSHSGVVWDSCNAEAVTYTETDHAEKSVITRAINCGETRLHGRKFIRAIAVSHKGESGPCGGCRQRIAEHADNCLILDVDPEGKIKRITSLKALLPYAFTPSHLGK